MRCFCYNNGFTKQHQHSVMHACVSRKCLKIHKKNGLMIASRIWEYIKANLTLRKFLYVKIIHPKF